METRNSALTKISKLAKIASPKLNNTNKEEDKENLIKSPKLANIASPEVKKVKKEVKIVNFNNIKMNDALNSFRRIKFY